MLRPLLLCLLPVLCAAADPPPINRMAGLNAQVSLTRAGKVLGTDTITFTDTTVSMGALTRLGFKSPVYTLTSSEKTQNYRVELPLPRGGATMAFVATWGWCMAGPTGLQGSITITKDNGDIESTFFNTDDKTTQRLYKEYSARLGPDALKPAGKEEKKKKK